MASISVNITTNELYVDDLKLGSWELNVKAGLSDNVDAILEEALNRVKGAIQTLPPEKQKYPEHLGLKQKLTQ